MNTEFKQIQKNTVDSSNQLKKTEFVTYINPDGKGKRIMFVGNSITFHGVKKEIGWNSEWGMAASSEEKDYVHRMMSMIHEKSKDCAFCICQVAAWERDYKNGSDLHHIFEAARDFDADIIIVRFVENCPVDDFDSDAFRKEMDLLLSYLNADREAKIVMSTGFWHHPGDEVIIRYARENHLPLVELGDLGENDAMKAIGLFEHGGVASHPGDLGMETIAERLFDKVRMFL